MVYRGSLQTDDPRDAPRLVRMSPLRSSRPSNPDSRAVSSVNSPVYHGPFVPAIDVHRAKLIDERRLPRCEREIESMEKVIMRTTGLKVGAPRLRNISQIRDTVFVDPALIPMEKIGRVEKDRPRTIAIEGATGRSSRAPSSMLADLKDLERLRNTPPAQRYQRGIAAAKKNEARSSVAPNKKSEISSSAKIRSDIFKIQQMFQSPDNCPRTVVKCSNEKKIEKRNECEKRSGGEINKTRLLAQKLLEASRSNRESLKDRYNNPRNASKVGKSVNGKSASSKACSQKSGVDPKRSEKGKSVVGSEEIHPQPPIRKRKESKNGRSCETDKTTVDDPGKKDKNDIEENSRSGENTGKEIETSSNDDNCSNNGDPTDESRARTKELNRPDILDGLLKECDRQMADLKSDLHERRRSRSHWRGFVQSMRLHDVELHSDTEDQRKGERVNVCSHFRLEISLLRVRKQIYRRHIHLRTYQR